ncbi:hypothetical protein KO488_14935 [Poseidonibacter lekithochrous]|uniref:hypothetical protein n=1 Tax=Poseidonibacter TaxID=2321187 RepID=UPI001C0964E8|nr:MULTISPECIES: hypothetical protein [Poseidonibacter]MBU3016050.1 hypothetical protein [Poseidonibacter lekithochrous]MDO6829349.1 hypothetical protein [Poseidonibacter sp. 1_MG-2023]
MNIKLVKKTFIITSLVLFLDGCGFNQQSIQSFAQTNSSIEIVKYKNEITSSLLKYKKKLDLRNPNSYNKKLAKNISFQIQKNQDYINISQNGKKLETYNEYFYYAFKDDEISNRNDFLILGLYKLIYKAFSLDTNHKFTALEYNKYELQKLYEYLQVLRWKIRTQKDVNGNYLFNTWQNNWQLELLHKDRNDLNIIKDLEYIKANKETIFSHSNFSFEVLLSRILLNVEYTLRKINIEPYEMSTSAIKSFIFIL